MDDLPILQAFKHIGVPVFTVAADGSVSHSNNAADTIFGYSDSIVGQNIADLLQVASISALNSFIVPPAIDANIKLMMGTTEKGDAIPLSVYMTSWSDGNGLQHAIIVRNLTDEMAKKKMSDGELKRANTAIYSAQIGVFEYMPIEDRAIVSGVWRTLMELDDTQDVDTQEEWRSRVHPDDLLTALEAVRLCADGEKVSAKSVYRLRSRDGSVWRWMQADVAASVKDSLGNVKSVIGSMRDVTEQKKTEESLRNSNEQFRSAFENSSTGNAIFGVDGQWRRANSALCDALGYKKRELFEISFLDLTHPDDQSIASKSFEELIAGNMETYLCDRRYIRRNGSVMWAQVTVSLVRDANGEPDHIISQIVDITEQRRLSELKGEFVATISHELRTPLTSVIGSLRLLTAMKTENYSDKVQRLLYIAERNGDRLYALINDILDFEKFSVKQMRFSLEKNAVAEQVEDAILANSNVADSFDVKFIASALDRTLFGELDPRRFQQVMTNLLTNAAKFSYRGSPVIVETEDVGNFVKISITNEGEGVPDSFREQIFTAFSQASATDTRARGGTGLGLIISKQIVEQTGGTIGFHSIKDNRTTFWFTVPKSS